MLRLILIYIYLLFLSLFGASLVTVCSVYIATWHTDVHYQWRFNDVKFILIIGGIQAIIFCVGATIYYIRIKRG